MSELISNTPEDEIIIPEGYVDPETLEPNTLETILKEGQITNLHLIEELGQKVPLHADRVLVGDIVPHADQVFGGDVSVPSGGKILVVYKPESGIGKGTDQSGGAHIRFPEKSSSFSNKEVAAWVLAKQLGWAKITAPTALRKLDEGLGSVRSYIWGDPLELLSEERLNKALDDHQELEQIAVYDYLMQTIDRRLANLIWHEKNGQEHLKAIDHSHTFISEQFSRYYTFKGPRMMLGYDNTVDPPKLSNNPLPNHILASIEQFIARRDEFNKEASDYLTEEEIDDIFTRAEKLLEQKIFL